MHRPGQFLLIFPINNRIDYFHDIESSCSHRISTKSIFSSIFYSSCIISTIFPNSLFFAPIHYPQRIWIVEIFSKPLFYSQIATNITTTEKE
ncbi:hypothetical protein ES705_36803 [subsurface metagenome]